MQMEGCVVIDRCGHCRVNTVLLTDGDGLVVLGNDTALAVG